MTNVTGSIPEAMCQAEELIVAVECELATCSCCECTSLLRRNQEIFNEVVFDLLSDETRRNINEEGSPPKQALDWLVHNHDLESFRPHRIIQRFVLALLFYETRGSEWNQKDGWLDETLSECDWLTSSHDGPCDARGVFYELILVDNNLNGALPVDLVLLDKLGKCTGV